MKMSWSPVQKLQLMSEKNILDKYFHADRVKWYNQVTNNAYIDVEMTSNSDNKYTLRVYLSQDYPNSCPEMVLVSPSNMRLKNGDALPRNEAKFHTAGERDTFIKICHSLPELWTGDNTIYQLFIKGRLWIEAYERHLDTGNDIDVYLKHKKELSSSEENLLNSKTLGKTKWCSIQ